MPSQPILSRQEIAEIAHELRSPLGGFEAMLDLLSRTGLDPEQARLVEALEASAAHLRAIIGRVLPSHEGEEPVVPALGPLLETIAASSKARAQARGLEFVLECAETLDQHANVESVALRQVLENLIDNAIRATPAGTIRLAVSPEGEGRLRFRLQDQGPGLDADYVARRVAQHAGAGQDRRGLGLPIAFRLVSQRGGVLQAQPRSDGAGTEFQFDWPLGLASAGGRRLLIVDDHPASRLVLRTILHALGFELREAESVTAATQWLDREAFAAILSDLHMPDGGGAVLLKKVAAMPAEMRPRTIVVSADDPRESPELATLVDQAVLKPLSVPALVSALRGAGLEPQPKAA